MTRDGCRAIVENASDPAHLSPVIASRRDVFASSRERAEALPRDQRFDRLSSDAQIERTLKLRIERLENESSEYDRPRRIVQNTLASRTLIKLPGEVFV